MATPTQENKSIDRIVTEIASWLAPHGLTNASQEELLEGYCARLVSSGVPVQRVHVAQRALHPVFGGLGVDWHRSGGMKREQYVRTTTPAERWVKSPFYYMMKEGISELREELTDIEAPHRFPVFDELRSNGGTDYFAIAMPFGVPIDDKSIDPDHPPEGIIISWTSDAADGFSSADIGVLRGLLPTLVLTLRSASNRQMARDLLSTYLGSDAGARVLSGEIQRGSLETIHAVIWYFDLRNFTQLSAANPGTSIISMLNDYLGSVVPLIEEHGGNVLKFMGDGLLAIFSFSDQHDANRSAIAAAAALPKVMADINQQRKAEGLPHTGFGLALHAGDVLYGNIGAEHRLDFTVIGSAVNVTARILGMCRSLEQNVIISSQVAKPVTLQSDDLVSLGRHMLRGVPEPQELFTLYQRPQ